MFVNKIQTDINDDSSVIFKNGYVFCKCIYPVTVPLINNLHTINTCFKLDDVDIIIEGVISKSTMDIVEFRNFTKNRNIIFSGIISYNESKNILEVDDVIFIDSIVK